MNAFHFRLQTVLKWRQVQLEVEEAQYKRLAAALSELDREREAVLEAGHREEMLVRGLGAISGDDLAALDGFRALVKRRTVALAARRAEGEKKLAAQQAVMLEARRRTRLLERLKERRWAEWRAADGKELEELAGESYAAQWVRREQDG